MTKRREGDLNPGTRFQSERFCKENGKWFFLTREGTTEGPFDLRETAEKKLADYVRVVNSGFMPLDSELAILPLESNPPE